MKIKRVLFLFLCYFILLAVISKWVNEKQQEQVDTEDKKLIKKMEEQFKSTLKISSYDYDESKNKLYIFINLKSKKDNTRKLTQEDLKNAFDILTFIEEYCSQQPDSKLSKAQKNVSFRGRSPAADFGINFCTDFNEFYFTEIYSSRICELPDLSIFTNIKKIYFVRSVSLEDIEPIKSMKNLEYLCLYWGESKEEEGMISKELKEALPDCEVVWSDWQG